MADHDPITAPRHYRGHPKGIECIDVIEDNPYVLLAQAMKYLWRVSWGGKDDDIQDLGKAIWNVERELGRRQAAIDVVEHRDGLGQVYATTSADTLGPFTTPGYVDTEQFVRGEE